MRSVRRGSQQVRLGVRSVREGMYHLGARVPEPSAFYVMDQGYLDSERLGRYDAFAEILRRSMGIILLTVVQIKCRMCFHHA